MLRQYLRSAAILACVIGLPMRAETIYLPVVSRATAPVPSDTWGLQDATWKSTLSVSNPTSNTLTFRLLRLFGGRSARIEVGCAGESLRVPPETSWDLSSIGYAGCVRPGSEPAMLEIDLDAGLLVSGGVHLAVARYCWSEPQPETLSLAAAPLPAYQGLFPAGATAVSVDIAFPHEPQKPRECVDETDAVTRRVNVTLFNGGASAATFTIAPVGGALAPLALELAPGAVLQLNDIYPTGRYRVLLVSADAPFLCYASSVTTWADPKRPPSIGVYPFRPIP